MEKSSSRTSNQRERSVVLSIQGFRNLLEGPQRPQKAAEWLLRGTTRAFDSARSQKGF